MSVCTSARHAANAAVTAPIQSITSPVAGASSNNGCARTTKYTPAATIVAACSSADTGVGPSIASGNHTCSGNCADLPMTPTNRSSVTAVATAVVGVAVHSNEPVATHSTTSPIRKPMSASFVIQNALT